MTMFPKFIAFDLETTGLSKDKDEIIEIGACKFTVELRNGRIEPKLLGEFETFVKPNMLIPEEATRVNHITDKMVENAPPLSECLQKFSAFCGQSSILLAHNADFDTGFLRVGYKKNPQYIPGNPVVDSLRISKCILPELKGPDGKSNHKLGFMADMFKKRKEISMEIDAEKMHRAVYDCEMLMEVFVALLRRRLKEKDWDMSNIMAAMTKYNCGTQFINK